MSSSGSMATPSPIIFLAKMSSGTLVISSTLPETGLSIVVGFTSFTSLILACEEVEVVVEVVLTAAPAVATAGLLPLRSLSSKPKTKVIINVATNEIKIMIQP